MTLISYILIIEALVLLALMLAFSVMNIRILERGTERE